MKTIESIGKTVEDAIAKGLDQLGIPRSEAEITVLDEGSKGVFGFLGVKFARVQIAAPSLDPDPEEPAEEADEEAEAPAPTAPTPAAYARPRERSERSDRREYAERPAPSMEDDPAEENPHSAAQFIYKLARLMGLPRPHVETREEEGGALYVDVDGPNVGPFIGHHGDALDALQLLTMLVVNPQGHDSESYHKVVLDVSGYRARRTQTLERLAHRLAKQVIETGESVDLEPMNAYERRIIHTALSDYTEIETWSEGDEPYRHIVIDLIDTGEYDDEDYDDSDSTQDK
ncbi:MAG: protein jag [Eubacteriales bacterium]|nr:protein jag [Eubacteriales bacterium]